MRIVFIGKPGSGKGTQSKLLSKRISVPHLSSGEILRAEVRARTELGKRVQTYIDRGEIGPAKLIAEAILSYIERKGTGNDYILDGFPRTMLQAELLDQRFPPDFVFHLEIEDDEVMRRLSKRLYCPSCEKIYHEVADPPKMPLTCDRCGGKLVTRKDDTVEVIGKRLAMFRDDILPIIGHYRRKGKLTEFDASKSPPEIHQEILKVIAPNHE